MTRVFVCARVRQKFLWEITAYAIDISFQILIDVEKLWNLREKTSAVYFVNIICNVIAYALG